jgi:RHS repeat-associated protein
MIGSTLMTSDGGCTLGTGTGFQPVRNAALDEWLSLGGVGVPPANPGIRYGSDGFYGYESGMITLAGANEDLSPVTLIHVGERWYQPGIGRFIQRDPIGIAGGQDCYAYAGSEPTGSIDDGGRTRWCVNSGTFAHHYVIVENHDPATRNRFPYWEIHYGPAGGKKKPWGPGAVTINPSGVTAGVCIASISAQDNELIRWARDRQKNPPYYNVLFCNCQGFAAEASRVGLPPEPRPEPREPKVPCGPHY